MGKQRRSKLSGDHSGKVKLAKAEERLRPAAHWRLHALILVGIDWQPLKPTRWHLLVPVTRNYVMAVFIGL